MDRKIQVVVTDELITPAANDDDAEVDVRVRYDRSYRARAIRDGSEGWKDCLEGLAEAIAMTIADNLQDYDLSQMAVDRVADVIMDRVRTLTRDSPLRSKPHAHIPGAMNVH